MGTCMQGERTVRVVVGTGSDGVVRWARAIRHAIRQNQTCTQTSSDALRRPQMHSDVLRCTQTSSDAIRRDDQTHLERRRSRVGEQRERECLDGGT
jgi:hypothetical protein